jgi:lipopolysaccharide export system protein LptC
MADAGIKHIIPLLLGVIVAMAAMSCQETVEHTAPAVRPQDSVAVMTSYGVNTLISDSGVIKYRIVTERWEVNQARNPSRWVFDKGLFLEQFDEKFHVQAYIQCDTAYYFDQQRLWELRSRVRILTKDGLRFNSEELYWDESKHELYSYVFSRLVTPERTLQGSYFRSDERMTHYYVTNSKGSFESEDFTGGGDNTTPTTPADTAVQQRSKATPSRME